MFALMHRMRSEIITSPSFTGDRVLGANLFENTMDRQTWAAAVTAHQLDIVRRMGLRVSDHPAAADLVVDALIGYGLQGDPAGQAAHLIEWTNRQPAAVLSLDTPSGLDVSTGDAGSPCVRASATMTLALPKVGLLASPDLVGDLFVADISVPPALLRRMGIDIGPLFADGAIVALGRPGRSPHRRNGGADATSRPWVRAMRGVTRKERPWARVPSADAHLVAPGSGGSAAVAAIWLVFATSHPIVTYHFAPGVVAVATRNEER